LDAAGNSSQLPDKAFEKEQEEMLLTVNNTEDPILGEIYHKSRVATE
jgi:hypothetical protein